MNREEKRKWVDNVLGGIIIFALLVVLVYFSLLL
jgi:hypothetical protein